MEWVAGMENLISIIAHFSNKRKKGEGVHNSEENAAYLWKS
jgi:hypothetical protein